jgi:hypothetical protein
MRAAALAPRVPALEIRIQAPWPPGLFVTLDGVEIPNARLNAPLSLDAGYHALEAVASGYDRFGVTLQVANPHTRLDSPLVALVQLSPLRPLAPPAIGSAPAPRAAAEAPLGIELARAPLQAPSPASAWAIERRELAMWVGGAGAVAGIIGGALIWRAQLLYDAAECPADECRTRADLERRKSAITLGHWSTALAILSASGLGCGIWLYASAPAGEATEARVGYRGEF